MIVKLLVRRPNEVHAVQSEVTLRQGCLRYVDFPCELYTIIGRYSCISAPERRDRPGRPARYFICLFPYGFFKDGVSISETATNAKTINENRIGKDV
jgi:hypothetical protein